MAQRDYKGLLGKLLTGFLVEEDPLKAMLEWLAEELMRVEAEARVGAEKGKHSEERKTHFSGFRLRRLNSRLAIMAPKVSKWNTYCFFEPVVKEAKQPS